MYTPLEIQLAHEIAHRLNDPAAYSQFLRYAKELPHEFLRASLDNACSVRNEDIEVSRAAIFVGRVKNYKMIHGNDRPRH